MPIFKKDTTDVTREKGRHGPAKASKKASIPPGLWTKCLSCQHVVYNKALRENLSVCPKCGYHFIIGAWERVEQFLDKNSFKEHDARLIPGDPLSFTGVKSYVDKLKEDQVRTRLNEACITGEGLLQAKKIALGVTDSRFIMGSMGSVVGEKITRLIEFAIEKDLPLVIISGSGGGARMYEGALSLMQMAKTSIALQRFQRLKKPYISVLTNPTMGGVMASFAALGDVVLAEPKALIGFAGPRVIEQTIRQKLPNDFQTSEFLQDRGMVDLVVHRKELPKVISTLLEYLG
ncbi:MAG TPA: acetyl-CoA carboxylase, carboxyltransferase subunit beta [Candidatus Omnitrophota bacterium]|nr:acetyl-CoA carboxylase, carboxyltransferase subunit beta [Candidatus Omnitrophota bacterium]